MESCFFNLSPQREQFKTFPPFFCSFNPCYYLLLTGNSRNDANDVMMENIREMFQWMQPHAISGEWHCTYVSVVWSLIDHTRDALEGSQCKYGYKTNIIFFKNKCGLWLCDNMKDLFKPKTNNGSTRLSVVWPVVSGGPFWENI